MVADYGGAERQQAILRELRADHAVGVIVAVNGRLLWADVFASTDLLAKYWPKLMPSYVAEAITSESKGSAPDVRDAESYIFSASPDVREITETEPGSYRRTERIGERYQVFELVSLLPKTNFLVHLAKAQVEKPEVRRGVLY